MKSKFAWVISSCLMVLSLVLVSCAPAVTEKEEVVAEDEEEKEEEVKEEEVAPAPGVAKYGGEYIWAPETEAPKYGGVFTWAVDAPRYMVHLDESQGPSGPMLLIKLFGDPLTAGDWSKGPAGTNEGNWSFSSYLVDTETGFGLTGGWLAESWEVGGDTMTFNIRKGVHFHDKPPVNGRELTAEDIAYSIKRMWTSPKNYLYVNRPWRQYFQEQGGQPWITATDKYTLEMKVLPGPSIEIARFLMSGWGGYPVAREMVEKWGGVVEDWRSACGTGAFILADAVPGSSWTFVRNPSYWMTNPCGPGKGNQLPYLDGVKLLEIYDPSTRMAAVRTGKIEGLREINWEDVESLQAPQLVIMEYEAGYPATAVWFRVDKPEDPLYDVRVRRALLLAVNNQEIRDDYFAGKAELLTLPVTPNKVYGDIMLTLDEYDRDIQELFEYHPDKAKQLLAEAGYPNGFKTSVVCPEFDVDLLSIVKDYWSKIGVDLEIQVKEYAVYDGLRTGFPRGYEHMISYATAGFIPFSFYTDRPRTSGNLSMVDDPYINEVIDKCLAAGWDLKEKGRIYREYLPYWQRQCFGLQLPRPAKYVVWQPWLKNYHGEYEIGYQNYLSWTRFIWIDQDLKEEMIGIR